MKKHYLWAALFYSAMLLSCKKEFNTKDSIAATNISQIKTRSTSFIEPPTLSKSMREMFTRRNAGKPVATLKKTVDGTVDGKLYNVSAREGSEFFKYLLYLNEEHDSGPVVIVSKKPLAANFQTNGERSVQFIDDNGINSNGHLVARRNGQQLALDTELSARSGEIGQVCIDWYWIILDEETGQVIGEVFIETTCYDEGDGGGGGGNNSGCNFTEEEATQALSAVSIQSLSSISSVEGMELEDADRKIRKAKTVKWVFLRMDGLAWTSQEWTAFFDGIVYKVNDPDPWKWESFQYSSTKMTEGSLPPCMEIDMQVGSVITLISADKKTASAALEWVATLKASCIGGWKLKTVSGNESASFPA